MGNKKRAKKRKKSNQSATDENGEDDSFGDLSLDIDIDEAEKTDAADTMENAIGTAAASKTEVSGKNDFETFVRSALVSMQRTMKKQQSSIDKIAQSQICIKTDIKSIDKKVSNLTSRVGAIESTLDVVNTDVTEIKTDVNRNKTQIENVIKTQEAQGNELKAVRSHTDTAKLRFDNIEKSVGDIKGKMTENKNTLKSLDEEMDSISKRTKQLEDDLYYALDEIDKAKEHSNRLERFSRENNLRLLNFREERDESVFDIVRSVLTQIGMPNAEVMKAHRTGKRAVQGGRTLPRQIIFKLLRHSDKQYALKYQRERLSGVPYYLVDDLTDMDLQKMKSYRDIIEDAKANDKRYKFRNGKLVIDGKLYIPE